MSASQETFDGRDLPVRLTIEREQNDHISPSERLREARESGEWREFEFFDPMVGKSGAQSARAVTRYADAREVLSQPGLVIGGLADAAEQQGESIAGQPGFLVFLEGEEHRRVKAVLSRHFGVKRVQGMRPEIERIADKLLDDLPADGATSADLYSAFFLPLPTLVVCYLMGVPYEDAHDLEYWSGLQTDITAPTEEVQAGAVALREYTAALVSRVKANPGGDLMSALVHDYIDTLSDEEVVGVAMNIFAAALDTTSRFGTLSTLTLLRNPEQLAYVREQGGLSEPDMDELLRFLSPATSTMQRYVTEDFTVGQNSMKKGERFMVSLLAANWDPEFIGDNPGLDLRRGRKSHLAFSYGTHTCAGQHLARLELSIALTKLFQRFPDLRFDGDYHDLGWMDNDLIYGIKSLPVAWGEG